MYLFRIWLGVTHYACIPEEIKYDINNHVINAQVKNRSNQRKEHIFVKSTLYV
jgi:hypothetical protein